LTVAQAALRRGRLGPGDKNGLALRFGNAAVDLAATVPFALATEVFVLAAKSNLRRYAGDS
jgi:hypothetical protein